MLTLGKTVEAGPVGDLEIYISVVVVVEKGRTADGALDDVAEILARSAERVDTDLCRHVDESHRNRIGPSLSTCWGRLRHLDE